MQKFINSDFFVILLIFVVFISLLSFFFLHQGLLLVDTGREFYLSQQVSKGAVLYKDIFNIFGPFSYQFNALLFRVFSEKIITLYIAGIVNSFIIVISLYLTAREFLKKSFSFLISIFTMFSLVFATSLYNSNITYSYGLIYALSSFLISLLFLIKFIKSDSPKLIYISCFFAGISIINKYEVLLYPFVLIYVVFFLKNNSLTIKLKSILCFFTVPVISFSILFIQGLTPIELKHAFELMAAMAQSDTMKLFYSYHGIIFKPVYYLNLILKNQFLYILGLLPIINIILFITTIKKIYADKSLFIFCISSILVSYKYTLFLNIHHMGIFVLPLCTLTLLILCKNFKIEENIKYIILTGLIFFFACSDFSSLKYKTYFLETKKGNIYTYKKDGEIIKIVSEYLIENSTDSDTVVILPEGCIINYITDRKSDNLYHTLYPPNYNDAFGEQNIIDHYTKNPAEYFVLIPLTTIEYGSDFFCTYAQKFCGIINDKYNLVKEEKNIKIYKRK